MSTPTPPPARDASVQLVHALPTPYPDSESPAGSELPDSFRAAAYNPGPFKPVPVVAIAGVDIPSGTVAGDVTGRVVVDGLSVRWGRDGLLDQAEPATGSLTLFDATKTWATTRNLVGQRCDLFWAGDVPGGAPERVRFFKGRLGKVKVRPHTVRLPSGRKVRGSLLTFPLVSILNDLANITPVGAWPEETVEARRARLFTYCGGVLGDLVVRDFWKTPNMAPVAADSQQSVWDHIVDLYDSCGADRMTYTPATDVLAHVTQRGYQGVRGLAGLWWNLDVEAEHPGRAGQGVYVRSYGLTLSGANPGNPHYLDGGVLAYDPDAGIERGPEQRISRVTVSNPDGTTAPNFTTRTLVTVVPDVNETAEGVRQLSLDSQLTWNAWADVARSDLVAIAQRQGRAWTMEPLALTVADGFETVQQGRYLLYGAETPSIVFLQRTWLPEYGVRPVFGIQGGTISYSGGAWHFTQQLSPVSTDIPQHSISWSEIDAGTAGYEVQLWDTPNPRGFHESLTLDDLRYVSQGLGATSTGPDYGWDEYQE